MPSGGYASGRGRQRCRLDGESGMYRNTSTAWLNDGLPSRSTGCMRSWSAAASAVMFSARLGSGDRMTACRTTPFRPAARACRQRRRCRCAIPRGINRIGIFREDQRVWQIVGPPARGYAEHGAPAQVGERTADAMLGVGLHGQGLDGDVPVHLHGTQWRDLRIGQWTMRVVIHVDQREHADDGDPDLDPMHRHPGEQPPPSEPARRRAAPSRRGPGADVEHGEVRGFTAQRLQAVAVLDGLPEHGLAPPPRSAACMAGYCSGGRRARNSI